MSAKRNCLRVRLIESRKHFSLGNAAGQSIKVFHKKQIMYWVTETITRAILYLGTGIAHRVGPYMLHSVLHRICCTACCAVYVAQHVAPYMLDSVLRRICCSACCTVYVVERVAPYSEQCCAIVWAVRCLAPLIYTTLCVVHTSTSWSPSALLQLILSCSQACPSAGQTDGALCPSSAR